MIKLLLSDDISSKNICVIPIVGMGGIGKTTLAQVLFNTDEVKKHYELKAWVCVSEDFDICRVTKTILEAVSLQACDVTDLNFLQVELKEKLTRKKFLIILDDIWNENYADWNLLRMPFKDGAQESKIIVTTRSESVASIMRTVPIHHLKELAGKACWKLFVKHASGCEDFTKSPVLEKIGREIVEKCKGLPLAIETLGGLLRSRLDIREWERILKSDIWDLRDGESNVLPALRLSYHYLPPYLKRCFSYCSIFPKAYEFEKEELISLWMAGNLLEHPKRNRRMEDMGDEYFNDHLVSRSFFQRSTTDKSHFVMHYLMADLAKFVSKKYCFLIEEGKLDEIVLKQARHIAYDMECHNPHEVFKVVSKATCLRTFLPLKLRELVFRSFSFGSLEILIHDLLKLRCLRYLSLSGYIDVKKLPISIGELRHLRYLDLSFKSIEVLPESLSMLYNLQTLKLSYCEYLTKLPTDLHHLINLRYLDVKGSGVVEMPEKTCKLQSLQELSAFIVGKNSGAKIEELGKLSNLRGRLSIYNLQNVVETSDDTWAEVLRDKQHLEELELKWSDETNDSRHERDVLDKLLPNTTLKKLKVEKYGSTTFSKWLGDQSFCNLVDLSFSNCKFCHTLPPLGQLSSLKTLSIEEFHAIEMVGLDFYGTSTSMVKPFASLKSLQFYRLSNWKKWLMPVLENVEPFPKLEKLSIYDCKRLSGDLPFLLPSLIKLSIFNCPELSASLPRIPIVNTLELRYCETLAEYRVVESFSCLQNLEISYYFEPITFQCLPATLKTLKISHCKHLVFPLHHTYESLQELSILYNSCWFITSFPLDSFPNIRNLHFEDCHNLEFFSLFKSLQSLSSLYIGGCPNFTFFPNNNLHCPILTQLTLRKCEKLKFLPEQLHNLLPSLQRLEISNCPELQSFPRSGLPLSLCYLEIEHCDKVIASRLNWNLQVIPNLTYFIIEEYGYEDMESFPKQGLLPITITHFVICKLDYLKTLDENGFQQLTSLKELYISGCPNLQTLPEEGLQTSLQSLNICGCPMLEEKCQRETGEYWSKIARIRSISINYEDIQ